MIEVRHSRGAYPVYFRSMEAAFAELAQSTCFIVTDENVREALANRLPSWPTLSLPPGEPTKSLIWLERIAEWLARSGASRKSQVVAVGGGVIGDLVGFAAATYMRGVPYVQIPTTLLAQVDSSVGGKVAVDLPAGKNLVGAFHPPVSVTIDTSTLSSLSPRQFRNGMAEVLKYGFILDPAVLTMNRQELDPMVRRCIELKAEVVAEDEFETLGIRAKLNFGHTVGHAIEQVAGYGALLHGEAISLGMIVEARLGEELGITAQGVTDQVREVLGNVGLPTQSEVLRRSDELIEAMKRDKKANRGALSFSLLTEIGGCKLVDGVEASAVLRALRSV